MRTRDNVLHMRSRKNVLHMLTWKNVLHKRTRRRYCTCALQGEGIIIKCFFLLLARIGEHDERKFEGYEEIIAGENYYIHPGFVVGDAKRPGHFDVALIKLKRPAVFYKRVLPVCLPEVTTNLTVGTSCYVTGWGKTAENNTHYSPVLNELQVDLVSKEVCNSNVSYNGTIPEEYFCAGFSGGGRDACYGDSGGPLVCANDEGQYVLRGVVSWGHGCARPDKYGVYLDVRRVLPFIEETIKRNT